MKERIKAAAGIVALLATGFLLGSLWFQWGAGVRSDGPGARGDPAPSSRLPGPSADRPRVEVLNGFGREGAARRAAERLRGMGFDVVYYGNADRFDHARTRVVRRSADSVAVRRVADSLGVAEVGARPEPALHVDGTVILGSDWDSLRAVRDSLRARAGGSLIELLADRLGL